MDRNKGLNDRRGSGQPALKEHELAGRWNISLRTLQRWRSDGLGPAYIQIGRTIRYLKDDVIAFEGQHRRAGGSQQ